MPEEAGTLRFEIASPDNVREGASVAVLLHGRGSDERDLLGLGPGLPRDLVIVTPRAPFSGREWGYGPGWAWYRYVAEDRVVPDTLERSLRELEGFLEGLPDTLGVQPGAVGLGGFSQGGTVSLAYGLRHPGRLAFVLNLSGFLVQAPGIEATASSVLQTPIFWGHGLHDPAIPYGLARKGRKRLRDAGADLTALDYEMGHGVSPQEVKDAAGWLETVLG